MRTKPKIGMLSLGCARNLVDAEVMLGYLKKAGFNVDAEISEADVAIVNTCCFIKDAEQESIETILKVCQLKEEAKVRKIIICGCLPERYKNKLTAELKEVDAFVGPGSIDKITGVVKEILTREKSIGKFTRPKFLYSHLSPRVMLTPRHFAYIKISEGCANNCSYCIIPKLRGKFRSRQLNSVLQEAEFLFKRQRANEINLIGQDTTMYGKDLYGQYKIAELLNRLTQRAGSKWIRLLYAHPAHFPKELIRAVKDKPAICKYIDLPIQHINDKILKRMNRKTTKRDILHLIDRLRTKIPSLAIRTTLIVGFPGETDKQFHELLDFMRQVKFERLGLFKYSRQEQTPAYNFTPQIPAKVKQSRYEEALRLQQEISEQVNQRFLGKTLSVLVDEQDLQDKHLFIGRTEYDAPEVDGCVYVKSKNNLQVGDFVNVKITDTLEYDLVADAIGQKTEDRKRKTRGDR